MRIQKFNERSHFQDRENMITNYFSDIIDSRKYSFLISDDEFDKNNDYFEISIKPLDYNNSDDEYYLIKGVRGVIDSVKELNPAINRLNNLSKTLSQVQESIGKFLPEDDLEKYEIEFSGNNLYEIGVRLYFSSTKENFINIFGPEVTINRHKMKKYFKSSFNMDMININLFKSYTALVKFEDVITNDNFVKIRKYFDDITTHVPQEMLPDNEEGESTEEEIEIKAFTSIIVDNSDNHVLKLTINPILDFRI